MLRAAKDRLKIKKGILLIGRSARAWTAHYV
jgi:hypothetical protein